MFTHCLSCRAKFPAPSLLEHPLPGARIAYDPARGRLWSICSVCRSWSLAPIEERWEALEELERATAAVPGSPRRAHLLAQTDNVALFALGPLGIVRVGASDRFEEAWWRYGPHLRADGRSLWRRDVGAMATFGAAIIGGVLSAALPARYPLLSPTEVRRWLRFGDRAWSGAARCALCGAPISELSFFDQTIVKLLPGHGDDGRPSLHRRCPHCRNEAEGGLHLVGYEAEQALRRMLAYRHVLGLSEQRVRSAMDLIDREGGPAQLIRVLVHFTNQLGDLPHDAAVALDVALNETRELRLLGLEMAAVEQYWQEAENLAAIVDEELTSVSGVERLRKRAVLAL